MSPFWHQKSSRRHPKVDIWEPFSASWGAPGDIWTPHWPPRVHPKSFQFFKANSFPGKGGGGKGVKEPKVDLGTPIRVVTFSDSLSSGFATSLIPVDVSVGRSGRTTLQEKNTRQLRARWHGGGFQRSRTLKISCFPIF